jgi:4-carboxymuconolactone decarboxylase
MDQKTYDTGLAIRKKVLSEKTVDAAFANATPFNMDMQHLSTEYCWGAVWGREGLDHKTRSMLNIAMISCLNRPNELQLHVKGARRNGVTEDEIREVLMQVAIYAGVPAGMDGFRNAMKALDEYNAEEAAK